MIYEPILNESQMILDSISYGNFIYLLNYYCVVRGCFFFVVVDTQLQNNMMAHKKNIVDLNLAFLI